MQSTRVARTETYEVGEPGAGVAALHLVLLGDPVEHSRSPAIHKAALRALGLTGTYVARRTDGVGVVAACVEIREGALGGANVTMPLKKAALAAVDAASDPARRAGSDAASTAASAAFFSGIVTFAPPRAPSRISTQAATTPTPSVRRAT